MPTTTAISATDPPGAHKRSVRNYLLDSRFQLKYTGFLVAVALMVSVFLGGFLYATATLNLKTGAVTDGKVTGGTGTFAGATGTLKAKNLNKSGTRTAVTIVYSG